MSRHAANLFFLLTLPLLLPIPGQAQRHGHEPVVVGQMRDVMWQGRLEGRLDLDTLADREHLYGLGPLEYLRGEILVLDGKGYRSTVTSDSTMALEETFQMKAPFFGYARVPRWRQLPMPDSVRSLPQLETWLDRITSDAPRPFFFRLSGQVERATIHIVNLPPGSEVRSPDDAHRGIVQYRIEDEPCELLGFFSTEHQTILTHHDTFQHLHLLTADRKRMGHVEEAWFGSGTMTLHLPVD